MLMADFATAVKYELPIKVVVIKNDFLGQIKWEQMVFLGNPEYGVELQPIDFVKVAEACGGTGITIDDPADARPASPRRWRGPVRSLIEAVVDPLEAPMPARHHARAGHPLRRVARPRPAEGARDRPARPARRSARWSRAEWVAPRT